MQDPGCKRWTARVRADGRVATADFTGSIHQARPVCSQHPSCDGSQFRHFAADKKPVPIDMLRRQIRAERVDAGMLYDGQIGLGS